MSVIISQTKWLQTIIAFVFISTADFNWKRDGERRLERGLPMMKEMKTMKIRKLDCKSNPFVIFKKSGSGNLAH